MLGNVPIKTAAHLLQTPKILLHGYRKTNCGLRTAAKLNKRMAGLAREECLKKSNSILLILPEMRWDTIQI